MQRREVKITDRVHAFKSWIKGLFVLLRWLTPVADKAVAIPEFIQCIVNRYRLKLHIPHERWQKANSGFTLQLGSTKQSFP